MVEVNHKIIITGVICLTIIETALIFSDKYDSILTTMIIGTIGLAVGVILPTPKVNNKRGVLIWETKKIWM